MVTESAEILSLRYEYCNTFIVPVFLAAASLMEEEMRIRRIWKAMRVIKERETVKKSQDKEEETIATDVILTFETSADDVHGDNTSKAAEHSENAKGETHVLIDISDILAHTDNNTADNTNENVTRGKTNNESDAGECEDENSHQDSSHQKANECLNCGERFPGQELLCKHAIKCSVVLQKYVMRMEKRREEAKRYARKKMELSRGRKVELTCGTCSEKFMTRNKLRQHITVRQT